jgi:hypothetical protein
VETIGRDVAILLWEPLNNRFEKEKEKDETTKPKKHSQDVYQVASIAYRDINLFLSTKPRLMFR